MYSLARRTEPCGTPAVSPGKAPKIIVVDPTGRIVDATPGARALLASGQLLGCDFDRLAATSRGAAARLAVALAQALRIGHAQAFFTPDEDADGDAIEAEFVVMGGIGAARRVVVVLKPAREERRRRLDEAQAGYGLTAAEGRLLATLFDGCSVPQAATRLGVAPSTARTHLQRIFDKTGARRQGDLMRIVAGG